MQSHKVILYLFSTSFGEVFTIIGATLTVIALQLFAIYTPLMQKILHTTSLNMSEWIIIIIVALSIVVVEEIRKFIYRHTNAK
ncbi:hypothetical protein A3I48_01140 [Candidatus Daviesbacteria bacterium RIFCSPLOWO2_02_FULL_36_7]|uniref:Cation-transporting P-type ATPase C-terminal domain-containing protein n=1 Tax=Candidatus Daviesbacteria bacterium RIFCSPLOWO2_02_FULL_36_7 TaxID=1797792 RepID=A0A1F5MHG2_9BACT|nr:MAG: hypothetical protein A3I48_01140 [Candidatus Daviesbacteria bacterium RIFCSPLOWO2_02_FULL_36_7]